MTTLRKPLRGLSVRCLRYSIIPTLDHAVSAVTLALALAGSLPIALAQSALSLQDARQKMVEEEITGAGVRNARVIDAMLTTPRHEFVAAKYRKQAYLDMSLPIGAKQTISSPFIVALMTESIDPKPSEKILEVGTGSGYQAAVLSPLVKHVYSIEIVESLGRKAARTLRRLKYDNVSLKIGDGYQGWAQHAPFDKIIVTCSPEQVPQRLVEQLKEDGLMVIPVGERYQQTLYLLTKSQGKLKTKALRPTLFVPMTGVAEGQRVVKPDPSRPTMVNGGFEDEVEPSQHIPGWYYQRQIRRESLPEAPEGDYVVTFQNEIDGRPSRALQGFPIDGRKVRQIEIAAWAKPQNVTEGSNPDMAAAVVVSIYDENRRDVGRVWLGPWRGTDDWRHTKRKFDVPRDAREAILRIGLFGATGKISFDDVQIRVTSR